MLVGNKNDLHMERYVLTHAPKGLMQIRIHMGNTGAHDSASYFCRVSRHFVAEMLI